MQRGQRAQAQGAREGAVEQRLSWGASERVTGTGAERWTDRRALEQPGVWRGNGQLPTRQHPFSSIFHLTPQQDSWGVKHVWLARTVLLVNSVSVVVLSGFINRTSSGSHKRATWGGEGGPTLSHEGLLHIALCGPVGLAGNTRNRYTDASLPVSMRVCNKILQGTWKNLSPDKPRQPVTT